MNCDVAGWLQISAHGEGLLNINDGSTVINSCTSQSGNPTECKCADSRLTMQDVNWYASNIPWNVDKLSYSYTKCTDSDRRGPDCEDFYLYDLSDLQNFNRDNSGGVPPVIYYVFRHADGSMVPDISLTRVEGTISAQVTVTFTVTVRHQTLEPVPVRAFPLTICHQSSAATCPTTPVMMLRSDAVEQSDLHTRTLRRTTPRRLRLSLSVHV